MSRDVDVRRIQHGILLLRSVLKPRFARFVTIGLINTLFGYSVFAGLLLISGQRTPSLIGATTIGVIFNFFTTGRFVFDNRSLHKLIPFCMAYMLALSFNIVLLDILTLAGVDALLGQAVCLPVVVVVSYVVNAWLVFGTS